MNSHPHFRAPTFVLVITLMSSLGVALPQEPAKPEQGPRVEQTREAAIHEAYQKQQLKQFEQATRLYDFQYYTNVAVLIAALVVLFSGLAMAWLQFKNTPKDKDGYLIQSTIKISAQDGLQISSPLIGLIVFVCSLVFFYLVLSGFFKLDLLTTTVK